VAGNAGASYGVAIDEFDSKQIGKPDSAPAELGTNRGFSHYFGLNNFFAANKPIITGDTVKGSAYNLRVQDRLLENANLITTGTLTLQQASTQTLNNDVYTYARYSGDNSTAQRLARLNSDLVSFDAAGGLPATQQSLQGYSSQLLGFISQRSSEATDSATNAKVLLDGFVSKSDAGSGVNLDEELANTITFQNAYAASARIITTVNKMYEDLLQSF
jgi:flagellar hook-associated protein 1